MRKVVYITKNGIVNTLAQSQANGGGLAVVVPIPEQKNFFEPKVPVAKPKC